MEILEPKTFSLSLQIKTETRQWNPFEELERPKSRKWLFYIVPPITNELWRKHYLFIYFIECIRDNTSFTKGFFLR